MFSMIMAVLLIQGGSTIAGNADERAASAGAESAQAAKDEKQVCRTFRVTGSRAKRERVCMTQAQWDAHEERTREEAGRVTNTGICSDGSVCSGT